MQLEQLVRLQYKFDAAHSSEFDWSAKIDPRSTRPIVHSVIALAGEVGEIANLVKKFDRGDADVAQVIAGLTDELADVLAYVFKLAYQCDIDLEQAYLSKMETNTDRFRWAEGNGPQAGED